MCGEYVCIHVCMYCMYECIYEFQLHHVQEYVCMYVCLYYVYSHCMYVCMYAVHCDYLTVLSFNAAMPFFSSSQQDSSSFNIKEAILSPLTKLNSFFFLSALTNGEKKPEKIKKKKKVFIHTYTYIHTHIYK